VAGNENHHAIPVFVVWMYPHVVGARRPNPMSMCPHPVAWAAVDLPSSNFSGPQPVERSRKGRHGESAQAADCREVRTYQGLGAGGGQLRVVRFRDWRSGRLCWLDGHASSRDANGDMSTYNMATPPGHRHGRNSHSGRFRHCVYGCGLSRQGVHAYQPAVSRSAGRAAGGGSMDATSSPACRA
jgi:hypothetical protein